MKCEKLIETGKPFIFSYENLKEIEQIKLIYPSTCSASAVMPVLWLAQKQNDNWISKEVVETVAATLNLPVMRVYEVVTFYSMYNTKPVGQYHIQVCRTTPCWLRGSDDILKSCFEVCGVSQVNHVSQDQKFSVIEVECLGACANAPMIQVNDDYYEDLTPQIVKELLLNFKEGRAVLRGSKKDRRCSEPQQNAQETEMINA